MRINIYYPFKDTAYGGGNQFLKALRDTWIKNNLYAKDPLDADVIIVNSHHFQNIKLIQHLKSRNNTVIIHRIDGPIQKVRGKDASVDHMIYFFNHNVADGTIFQSEWSKEENYLLGYEKNRFETVIPNAPDPDIFYPLHSTRCGGRVRIIATSWSGNLNKGFDIYKFLDNHLDFNQFQMTFAGNSPIEFQNIQNLKPLPSKELADILRQHDIYITASRNEPYSNSLIEALHCKLPAVYRIGSSHGTIVGNGGEGFRGKDDVLVTIENVTRNIEKYRSLIHLKTLEEVADAYYLFCRNIYENSQDSNYHPKRFSLSTLYRIIFDTSIQNAKRYVPFP